MRLTLIFATTKIVLLLSFKPHSISASMPLAAHLAIAAAWFWWVTISFQLHHALPRPRLHARRSAVDNRIRSERHSRDLIRLSPAEFKQLCQLLFVTDVQKGNWRFTSAQRCIIALYSLANQHPLRKASVTFGWSIASLQYNLHWFVDRVIEHLDHPASRQCSPLAACPFAPSLIRVASLSLSNTRMDRRRAEAVDGCSQRAASVRRLHRHR